MTHHKQAFKIRVPGKLLLAGEYAILSPGALALVLAVNRYFYAEATPSVGGDVVFRLSSAQFAEQVLQANTLDGITPQAAPEALRFAAAAWQTTVHYLQLQGFAPAGEGLHLHLDSQLQVGSLKLGLGSSAACCVAVVTALCHWAWPEQDLDTLRPVIFKLAYLAHYGAQGSGSGADVAGCVYGSAVAYHRPDLSRVADPYQAEWPMLGLKKVTWPDWPLLFGWTQRSADSKTFIADFQAWQAEAPDTAEAFLFQMQMATLALQNTLEQQDQKGFVSQLKAQRRLLQGLNTVLISPPETPALKALADVAEALGGAGKFSGAGGGDCGLAWVPRAYAPIVRQHWQVQGIKPLDLGLNFDGVTLL